MSTKIIAQNSVWLGVEAALDFATAMFASIAIARGIGPERMGYYVYISWLTSMSVVLGNVGVPAMAVKYMAEYYGRDLPGVAKALYQRAFRIQLGLAAAITAVGVTLVWLYCSPAYKTPSLFLVLSILPAMANTMPTIANIASERPDRNVLGSFASSVLYVSAVAASLVSGWGLTGIALGILVSRTVELVIRLIPVQTRMSVVLRVPIPPELRAKMASFSAQSMVIMLLGVVVWDRSEILFLKRYCTDVRQIAFYSVAFSLSEKALTVVRILGNSIATTIRAQYGRDESRLQKMIATAAKYIAVVSCPVYFGLAAMCAPAILIAYGKAYAPAIPVLMITAVLTIPKAFYVPIQAMLQSTERQGFVVRWGLLSAAINLALDWFLIQRYGAIGAAWGNGLAQTFAVAGLWIGSVHMFRLKLPYRALGRTLAASLIMAVVVSVPVHFLPSVPAALIGIPTGVAVCLLVMRLLRVLDQEDRDRFQQLREGLPRFCRGAFDWMLSALAGGRTIQADVLEEVT